MVFGLFSKKSGLQRTIDKATNKLAQQQDRWPALERLRDEGSEEALLGLCKRFGITSLKGVEDEQEKNWVVDTLVDADRVPVEVVDVSGDTAKLMPGTTRGIAAGMKIELNGVELVVVDATEKYATVQLGAAAKVTKVGQTAHARLSPHPALAAVARYMKSAEQIAFPLKVLERIASHDKILQVIDELFAGEPPGYVRMPERRIDLLRWFTEWKDASDDEVIPRVTPYIGDFDENVRFTAIDGLAGRDPHKFAGPLIDALLRPEEESGRIRRTIVEVLERTKAPLGDRAGKVGAALTGPLADDFKLDAGVIKKK
jgi:hypothetical protein